MKIAAAGLALVLVPACTTPPGETRPRVVYELRAEGGRGLIDLTYRDPETGRRVWLRDVGRRWRLTFDEFSGAEALVAARTRSIAGNLVCSVEVAYPDRYVRVEVDKGRRQCRVEEEP